MKRDHLISPEYLAEQQRLHQQPEGYGAKGHKWADLVAGIARVTGGHILDYGTGQGSLVHELRSRGITAHGYDPARPEWCHEPEPASTVVCTDVLEHVESEKIDAVVAHLFALTKSYLFVVVSTVETAKLLSDGRQAHISIHPKEWWIERFHAAGFFVLDEPDVHNPHKQFALVLEKTDPNA